MKIDCIEYIEIDGEQRLHIKPEFEKLTLIYRTATEVHWDDKRMTLYSPKPRNWNYLDWFKHITNVSETECSIKLELTEKTEWINIPNELKNEITKAQSSRRPRQL
jgi:hypothetical protein